MQFEIEDYTDEVTDRTQDFIHNLVSVLVASGLETSKRHLNELGFRFLVNNRRQYTIFDRTGAEISLRQCVYATAMDLQRKRNEQQCSN